MADSKTWRIDVEFEQFHRGQLVNCEPTERIASLVGAGYMHDVTPVYEVDNTTALTAAERADLLSEEDAPTPPDLDEGVASKRRIRKG